MCYAPSFITRPATRDEFERLDPLTQAHYRGGLRDYILVDPATMERIPVPSTGGINGRAGWWLRIGRPFVSLRRPQGARAEFDGRSLIESGLDFSVDEVCASPAAIPTAA